MLDWDDLRYFLAVAEQGTLARAATALGINATTVGRRLSALEERIGTRLLDRTPEGFVLTPAGHDLLPHAVRMQQEALSLEREVIGRDQHAAGLVRVSATEMLGTRFITPYLWRLAARYPEITVALECTNRSVSLARREADIALRLARPHEDNVVTRRLSNIPLALYACANYLERRGRPSDPERSLRGQDVVLFADSRPFRVENSWFEPRLDGARIALRSDSVSSIYSATLAGIGIALLPSKVADRDSLLVRLDTATTPEPREIWQAVHADLQRSARVRAVLDFLAELFTGT